jgi:transcriptional regulator with XRE-family HTH domain
MDADAARTQNIASPTRKNNRIDLADILRYRLEKGLTYQEIADMYGLNKSSIFAKFQGFLKYADPEAVRLWEEKKPEMLSASEMVLVERMMDEDVLKKASVNNLAYALGTVNNINRLHRGQATQNVSVKALSMSLADLVAEEDRLRKKLSEGTDNADEPILQ